MIEIHEKHKGLYRWEFNPKFPNDETIDIRKKLDQKVVIKNISFQDFCEDYKELLSISQGPKLLDVIHNPQRYSGNIEDLESCFHEGEQASELETTTTLRELVVCLQAHYGQLDEDISIYGMHEVSSTIERIRMLQKWMGEENLNYLVEKGIITGRFSLSQEVNSLLMASVHDFQNASEEINNSSYSSFTDSRGYEIDPIGPIVNDEDLDKLRNLTNITRRLYHVKDVCEYG